MDFRIKENAYVGLHDCRTNKIDINDNSITFHFPDGFYYIEEPKDPQKTENCDAAMTCHLLENEISAVVFRKNLFGKIVREDWSDRFAAAVNSGEIEFEFVYTYRSYQSILFKGYVWRNKKPWSRECEIEFRTDEITYEWSER